VPLPVTSDCSFCMITRGTRWLIPHVWPTLATIVAAVSPRAPA
jgi:hypothetical protein